MGGNAVADWASVDALALFPAMREARLSAHPVTTAEQGGGRVEVTVTWLGLCAFLVICTFPALAVWR